VSAELLTGSEDSSIPAAKARPGWSCPLFNGGMRQPAPLPSGAYGIASG